MADESATTTYHLSESFEDGVQAVRRALLDAGLKISGELNMSERLQRRLQVNTAPCKVLFVGPASQTRNGVGYAPLHVVISARGSHAEIHILRVPVLTDTPGPELSELGKLRAQVAQAIERIAMRALLGA